MSSLMVCISQISGMVLCLVHVVSVKIRRITLPKKILHNHLLCSPDMSGYNCVTKHGERGVIMEGNKEEEDDDNNPEFLEYGCTAMRQDEEEAPDEPTDDLGRPLLMHRETANEKRRG
jgi:hypothetical protein